MPTKIKLNNKPLVRKPGSAEEITPKFRAKILGLSAVSEQNSALSNERDENGEGKNQEELVTQLQEELTRRQESYIRRERQYKVRIAELEAQVSDSRAKQSREISIDASMEKLRQMHRTIIENVDQVQDRTSKILQEQEKDLLRAFRARLYSVQEELESEKNKTDDGASAWIEKSKQLETEVEWTKELADRLDRLNQSLTRENQRLKTQFTTQENDREFLVKQLVMVKKDNVRLRNEYDALCKQVDQMKEEAKQSVVGLSASTSALPKVHFQSSMTSTHLNGQTQPQRPTTAVIGGTSSMHLLPEADNRYKEIIKRLKRLLEVERRNLQQVRTAYKSELQNRTELEVLLRECVQDVRAEISHYSQQPLPTVRSSTTLMLLSSMSTDTTRQWTTTERQRLVEKLLAKERFLSVLTAKAFPIHHGKSHGDPLVTGDGISPEEMAKMYGEIGGSSH